MAAPKGNTFYKLVANPFRKPKKYTPKQLWRKALQYFEYVSSNPLMEMKAFANGKTKSLPKMRVMTEIAFCLHVGISQDTFSNMKKGLNGYEDYVGVSTKIAEIIYQYKFEGAAADFLNPNIIARDLGLREKTELTGKDGKDLVPPKQLLDVSHLSVDEIEQLLLKYGNQ